MNMKRVKRDRKHGPAEDILALHTVSTLPDSLEARRRILFALLTACRRSNYAERIAVMLECLEQHLAFAVQVQDQSPK
jgi:hypothetical protein